MYFWKLNSNIFPELLYHPHLSHCIGLCERTSLNWYFYLTSISGVTAQSKHPVQYPNLPYAMRTVPHIADLPVPKPPTNITLSDSESSDEDLGQTNNSMDCDPTFARACSSNEPHLLTQGNLNDIVCDLNLSKKQAGLLGSKLKVWNLLHQDTLVCFCRVYHEEFEDFFSLEDGVVFCNDFCSVMEVLGHEYDPDQFSSACSLIRQKWAWRKEIPLRSFGSCSQHEGKLWKHEAIIGKD